METGINGFTIVEISNLAFTVACSCYTFQSIALAGISNPEFPINRAVSIDRRAHPSSQLY